MSISLIFCFCFVSFQSAIAQQTDFPIKKWKTQLSVKKDLCTRNLTEVFSEMAALDSLQRCDALEALSEDAQNGNTRYKIRAAILRGKFADQYPDCTQQQEVIELLENELQHSYALEDHLLATEIHYALSELYFNRNDLSLAVVHQQLGIEHAEQEGLDVFCHHSSALYSLADLLYRSRDFREVVNVSNQVLQYRGGGTLNQSDSLPLHWQMIIWNHLGLSYERLEKYDSAFYAFNQAYALTEDPFWRGLLSGNRGDVFFYHLCSRIKYRAGPGFVCKRSKWTPVVLSGWTRAYEYFR